MKIKINPKIVIEFLRKSAIFICSCFCIKVERKERIDSVPGKMRTSVEDDDRLSRLPDDLIHKILSFIDIDDAIHTCVLSSRWRFIWTCMPYLNLSHKTFHSKYDTVDLRPSFFKFINRVLSHRNNEIKVFSIKLNCGMCNLMRAKKILEYAFDYHIEHVTRTRLYARKQDFPVSLFSSEYLKHLTLTGSNERQLFMPASTWELLALTTLHLDYVTLYNDNDTDKCISLFSMCINLQNLTLNCCRVTGLGGFHICHPRLSNLTLQYGDSSVKLVSVVAPRLVNLIINRCGRKHIVSAPRLASFVFEDISPLQFSADGFPSLKKVDLCFSSQTDARNIVGLFHHLNSVQFLTLNLELVEFLYSSMELISHQPSPFVNLKNLNIYMDDVFREARDITCTEVIVYLLNRSPSATFKMISDKEVIALGRRTHAEDFMVELRVLLEQEKANIETNMAEMDQGIAQVENQMEMQQHIRQMNGQIRNCWKNLTVRIEQGNAKICCIISKLQDIEELMTELSASKRGKIQPSFASLRVEANNVINKIMDCMKIQCGNLMKSKAI